MIGGNGVVIEYALKMLQFPQSQLLSTLQKANGELTAAHVMKWPNKLLISSTPMYRWNTTKALQ